MKITLSLSTRAFSRRLRAPSIGLLAALALSITFPARAAGPDILVSDFEAGEWSGWTAAGEAFGPRPAGGTLPGQMQVDGFLGRGLANSFHGGDGSKGTLTSAPFTLQRPFLRFLVGGGKNFELTCLRLLIDGRAVRTATGPNDRPGGSERLDWDQWNVAEFVGRTAVIEIVDQATGGWGHINVDQIVQTDQRLPLWQDHVRREIEVTGDYLNLPVKNGAPKRVMTVRVDGQVRRQFEIELADGAPDWWAFVEARDFRGKTAVIEVDKLREDSQGLRTIESGNHLRAPVPLYEEALRPQFHFTSRRGWNNDPNGLVFHAGEYHLFYQHNPYGWSWGNMHWGHAVSPDLIHWRELGEALYPDELGTMFSGSAVVDTANTSGLGSRGKPPLVCIYTAAGNTSLASQGKRFTQGIATSLDRGRTWTKYGGNPVLPHIAAENRDPKVLWHEPTKRWVMALYLNDSDFALFASTNLLQWDKLSGITLPGTSECPDFFEIPVAGRSKESRWVFYGGNGRYLVGSFDGRTFTQEAGPQPLNFGNCFYASQSYDGIPKKDGRRILVTWGQINLPGMPFNQMIGLPVELTLRPTEDGLRLFANPVREIAKLRSGAKQFKPSVLRPGEKALGGFESELLEVAVDVRVGAATEIALEVRGVPVTYDVARQELRCLDRKAPMKPVDGRIRIRVLADRASLDIFANDGRVYMPMGVVLSPGKLGLGLTASGGEASVVSAKAYRLRSAWRR
jgi:fructan beta-fructosidase